MRATLLLLFLPLALLGNLASAATETESSKVFQKVWDKFSDVSTEAIELATDKDRTTRSTLEYLTHREPKYVRLLKKAQDILSDSEASSQFASIDALTLKNKDLEKEIVTLKRARISAPTSSYNPLVKTKERIDKRLAKIPLEIEENTAQIEALQKEILAILRKNGLSLSPEELHYFIISAEGSELIRLMNIANNMKKIQHVIEQELVHDRTNVQLAKYYTGMYLISLETYRSAHDVALEKLPAYRAKVQEIVREATNNHDEAHALRRTAEPTEIANLDANIKINTQIISVGKMYASLLRKREIFLEKSRENVNKKVQLAMNTYKTIVNGSSLISLVNTESGEFSLLMNFEMPELKLIYDTAMLHAFMDIADKIKQEK